jgi:hypothetical protein
MWNDESFERGCRAARRAAPAPGRAGPSRRADPRSSRHEPGTDPPPNGDDPGLEIVTSTATGLGDLPASFARISNSLHHPFIDRSLKILAITRLPCPQSESNRCAPMGKTIVKLRRAAE